MKSGCIQQNLKTKTILVCLCLCIRRRRVGASCEQVYEKDQGTTRGAAWQK